MNISRLACVFSALFAVSCAESAGPVMVDAEWNLTCPDDNAVGCGSLAPETCLGGVGDRAIVGSFGEASCTGDPIIATCEAVERPNGLRAVLLEVNVGDSDSDGIPDFGFELRGAVIDAADGSVQESACNVTVFEDGLDYGVGACGEDPPSMEQPCQLSNISTQGSEVVFDLECKSLISSITVNGFDVGAVGGGPTTIRFSNCTGF